MIGGKIAGAAAAYRQGYLEESEFFIRVEAFNTSLRQLREGQFGHKMKGKAVSHTEEGIELSSNLLKKGYVADEEIERFPGIPSAEKRSRGLTPVIECTQNIPCDPCRDACAKGCIRISDNIIDLPSLQDEVQCTGCGMCVAACPGQAIFLVDETYNEEEALIGIPYEFYPLPDPGETGAVFTRAGKPAGTGKVVRVQKAKVLDGTSVLWISVPKSRSMDVRFFKPLSAAVGAEV